MQEHNGLETVSATIPERALSIVGRLLLALYFLLPGIMKIVDFNGTAEYMAAHGMVAIPFFLVLTIVLQVGGVVGERGEGRGFTRRTYYRRPRWILACHATINVYSQDCNLRFILNSSDFILNSS